ncbi:hypothetical protein ACFPOC_11630 [Rubellimicrobium aerolatum]|uniref:Uncharacterized protein n=1 Tax=Rubellimicrobium aerolatum TaxID=490979 RepID=A0ABW0SDL1_9RHOB
MPTLFRRRYTVTLYASEPDLDLRDEISEALMGIESDSIVIGVVETEGGEAEASSEDAERDLDAAEVGFATVSEEEYARLQDEDET